MLISTDSRLCGKPLQRFELREAKSEKRENLRLDYNPSVSERSRNKQGLRELIAEWIELVIICLDELFIPYLCPVIFCMTIVVHSALDTQLTLLGPVRLTL